MVQLQKLAQRAQSETITLLFATTDEAHNNAQALKEFIDALNADR